MDFLPKGKHLTLFTPFLAQGVDGFAPVITAPSRHFGRAVTFLGSNASSTTACHEYGHTFGLRHTFLDVPLIGTLFAAPMPNVMGGIWSMAKYLTPEQAAIAREVASGY